MKQQVQLALVVVAEMSEANPEAEIDWRDVKAEVKARLVLDMDSLKAAAAADGVNEARRIVTRALTDQLPMPGFPPQRDAFLPFEEHKSVKAGRGKMGHIIGATRLRQDDLDKQYRSFSNWQAATLPLYPYLAKGMDWDEAAAAYASDHPEAQAAD